MYSEFIKEILTEIPVKDYAENILKDIYMHKLSYSFYFSDVYDHNLN